MAASSCGPRVIFGQAHFTDRKVRLRNQSPWSLPRLWALCHAACPAGQGSRSHLQPGPLEPGRLALHPQPPPDIPLLAAWRGGQHSGHGAGPPAGVGQAFPCLWPQCLLCDSGPHCSTAKATGGLLCLNLPGPAYHTLCPSCPLYPCLGSRARGTTAG